MIRALLLLCPVLILAQQAGPGRAQKPRPVIRDDIPYFTDVHPKPEQPVTAVVSRDGMRVLVSRDDGKTWKQTFLLTDKKEELGDHSSAVVRGVTYTDGLLAAFAGWGARGHFLGSADGEKWGYLTPKDMKMDNVWAWDAAAGTRRSPSSRSTPPPSRGPAPA